LPCVLRSGSACWVARKILPPMAEKRSSIHDEICRKLNLSLCRPKRLHWKVGGFVRYHTHIVSSLALGAGIATYTPVSFTISYAAGLMIGSLLPDIDEPNSYIGRRSFGISNQVKKAFGHRGFTHSLLAFIIVAAFLLSQHYSLFTLGLCLGYGFHILADYCSTQGVPLLWPFQRKRYRFFLSYRTSSFLETILFYSFTALFLYFLNNGCGKELMRSMMQFGN
jgi:inner membrane protein